MAKRSHATVAKEVTRILEYRSKGLTNEEIANALDISTKQVIAVVDEFEPFLKQLELNPNWKTKKPDILSAGQLIGLKTVLGKNGRKFKEAGVKDAMAAIKQLFEMERLERGLSTKNVSSKVEVTTKYTDVDLNTYKR